MHQKKMQSTTTRPSIPLHHFSASEGKREATCLEATRASLLGRWGLHARRPRPGVVAPLHAEVGGLPRAAWRRRGRPSTRRPRGAQAAWADAARWLGLAGGGRRLGRRAQVAWAPCARGDAEWSSRAEVEQRRCADGGAPVLRRLGFEVARGKTRTKTEQKTELTSVVHSRVQWAFQ